MLSMPPVFSEAVRFQNTYSKRLYVIGLASRTQIFIVLALHHTKLESRGWVADRKSEIYCYCKYILDYPRLYARFEYNLFPDLQISTDNGEHFLGFSFFLGINLLGVMLRKTQFRQLWFIVLSKWAKNRLSIRNRIWDLNVRYELQSWNLYFCNVKYN